MRLSLQRSNACALLERGEPDDEIREALRSGEIEAIAPALAGVRAELVPASALSQAEKEIFIKHVASFVKLTGGGWPQEQRQEFIMQAAIDLSGFPIALVNEAIDEARKRVWEPKRFVSWIVERIEPRVEKLEAEAARLVRLAEIAEISG